MTGDFSISFELGPDGARRAARRGDIMVVVDALRATSTIVTALGNGVRSVRPVATIDECQGELTAAEQDCVKHEDSDLDNSPLSFMNEVHAGKELVLRTSNGTQCIAAAAGADGVIIAGALLNARSCAGFVASRAYESGRNVTFVLAGRKGQIAIEDGITAAAISEIMQPSSAPRQFLCTPEQSEDAFLSSSTGRHLAKMGKIEDVRFCARSDVFDMVPLLRGNSFLPDVLMQ